MHHYTVYYFVFISCLLFLSLLLFSYSQFKVGETYMMTMQDKWKNYFYPAVTVFDANYAVTRKMPGDKL